MTPRRRKSDADELADALVQAPWWVSAVLAVLAFIALRFLVPAIWPDRASINGQMASVASQFAWLVAGFLLVAALISFARSIGKRRLLDRQNGIESIRDLSWKQFEELLGEAYRRKGFAVSENAGMGADGGIDLTLRRGTESYLVQCKQWKTYSVGVKVVREMLGLVTAHAATGAIVVTCGTFTSEAVSFAATNRVELIDGDDLLVLIGEVHRNPASVAKAAPKSIRSCPKCGQPMVLRTAKRGANAGCQFLGCSGYPQCRHTEPVAAG